MTRRPPRDDACDDVAFQALLSDVTPLRPSNRAALDRPRPRPVPGHRTGEEREALQENLSDWTPWDAGYETGEHLVYARPGMQAHTLRKLRRGHWPIQAVLDLHGHTSAEARLAVAEFLARCKREQLRCVRIIHGKGLSSPNREPVLKRKLAAWLMQRQEILAFCEARHAEGGGGATMVLLKT
jgi:DNA-nicking Smr family endonuclease